jgi:hypothetical protein
MMLFARHGFREVADVHGVAKILEEIGGRADPREDFNKRGTSSHFVEASA